MDEIAEAPREQARGMEQINRNASGMESVIVIFRSQCSGEVS